MIERIRPIACIRTVYVIVQIASSEQVLGVEISHFEIMYNSTIKFGNYCCCDEPGYSPCVETPETLQKCPTGCDPYFSVHFQHCPANKNCTILTKNITLSFDPVSETPVSPFIFQIPFDQLDQELYNQVRICSYTISNNVTNET